MRKQMIGNLTSFSERLKRQEQRRAREKVNGYTGAPSCIAGNLSLDFMLWSATNRFDTGEKLK